MALKQKKLEDLKAGQKFRFKRRLYIVNKDSCPVCLSDGDVPSWIILSDNALVTPVKVRITVK